VNRISDDRLRVSPFLLKSTELVGGKPPLINSDIYDDGCEAYVVDTKQSFIFYADEWWEQ
jgi:hypothetical protein